MKLVVDNNIFSRTFKNVPLDVFDDIWVPWSELIDKGILISVDEVYREMAARWSIDSDEGNWLKNHKKAFLKLTDLDGLYLAKIFENKKFREGIKEKSLRNGTPEADAMLVAKAKVENAIVVTAESDEKPNSEKIPNIADSLGVPYMNINNFYKLLKNIYNKKPLDDSIYICTKLQKEVLLRDYLKVINVAS